MPSIAPSGSISSHGNTTKARSCARGCGSVSTGSSLCSSPYASTSTSSVRGPQCSSRTRPGSCFKSVRDGKQLRSGQRRVDEHDRVVEVGLRGSAYGRSLDRSPTRQRRRFAQQVRRAPPGVLRPDHRDSNPTPGPPSCTALIARALRANDRDDHVIERQRNGCRGLVHADLHRRHARIRETRGRDPLGQRLEQIHRLAGHDGSDRKSERAVVSRVGERRRIAPQSRCRRLARHRPRSPDPPRARDSNTPWCPRTSRPRSSMRSLIVRALHRAATRTASTSAPTSCTRTAHAPAAAANAVIGRARVVALSRQGAARRQPASSRPRNAFREAPINTGRSRDDQHVEMAKQRPVVVTVRTLGEAKARIEDDLLDTDARVDDSGDPRLKFTPNVGDDVVIDGALLHIGTVPSPVHHDKRHAGRRDEGHHRRVGQPATDVIDQHRAGVNRLSRDIGVHRVDTHRCSGPRELSDDGKYPPQLFLRIDPHRAGPGGFAADVDDVSTGRHQFEPVLDRGVGIEPLATIRKRVGRDVHDTHDPAAPQLGKAHQPAHAAGPSRMSWRSWRMRGCGHTMNASASSAAMAMRGRSLAPGKTM